MAYCRFCFCYWEKAIFLITTVSTSRLTTDLSFLHLYKLQ